MTALETTGLGKSYGSAVTALSALDLSIPKGVCYGILGPNGAGKSTLLRMVLGLVKPSRGSYRLLGEANVDVAVLRRIGAMIERRRSTPSSPRATCSTPPRRCPASMSLGRIDAVLERVNLTDAANCKAKTYSMGMRQRLALAAALLTRPELLILDEPTNGLDPAGIQEMRTLVRDLVDREGVTIILSSHLLDEVQKVCDRVAILNHGKLIAEGRVADLVAGKGALFISASPIDKALAILGPRGRPHPEGLLAEIPREAAPALIRELTTAGIDIFEARWMTQSLEDVFLSTTGNAS